MEKEKAMDLIEKIEQAKDNIVKLDKEVLEVTTTKQDLLDTTKSFRDVNEKLGEMVEAHKQLISDVEKIGAEKTLEEFKHNSDHIISEFTFNSGRLVNEVQTTSKNMEDYFTSQSNNIITDLKEENAKTIKQIKKTAIIWCSVVGTVSSIAIIITVILFALR